MAKSVEPKASASNGKRGPNKNGNRKDHGLRRATPLRGDALRDATIAAAIAEIEKEEIAAGLDREQRAGREAWFPPVTVEDLRWTEERTARLSAYVREVSSFADDPTAEPMPPAPKDPITEAARALIRQIDRHPDPPSWALGMRKALEPWPWAFAKKGPSSDERSRQRRNLAHMGLLEHVPPPPLRRMALLSCIAGIPDFDAMGKRTPAEAILHEKNTIAHVLQKIAPGVWGQDRQG